MKWWHGWAPLVVGPVACLVFIPSWRPAWAFMLPVEEFLRHEIQGKSVNQFSVSEDGQSWTTFGRWRQTRL